MNWQALLSFRVIFLSLIGAAIVGAIVSQISEGLGSAVTVLAFFGIWAAAALNTDLVLYCPYCRKRVKIGADVCHHCGRDVHVAR